MPATEHIKVTNLQRPTSLVSESPDTHEQLQTFSIDDLSALLSSIDDHISTDDSLDEALISTSTGKRERSVGSDDDDTKSSNVRLRTYTARKKEIDALLEEIPSLEAYVDYLKHQAAKINNQTNTTQKQQLVNSCLRNTAHKQQFALARTHSALSDFTCRQEKLIPFDNFIHLGKDRKHRLQTLLHVKPTMLRDARRFMRERTAFMDLSVPSSEQSSSVSPSGDYCALKLVVMPLEGAFTATQVFDRKNPVTRSCLSTGF